MNNRGRIACCGAISQYDGVPSAHGPRGVPGLIVVKRLIMQGFIVMDYMDQRDQALKDLQSWVAAGKLKVQEDVIDGPGEHAEGADRAAGRREPRQADGEGVGESISSSSRPPSRDPYAALLSCKPSIDAVERSRVWVPDQRSLCSLVRRTGSSASHPAPLAAPALRSFVPPASSRTAAPRRRTSARTARRGRSRRSCRRTP